MYILVIVTNLNTFTIKLLNIFILILNHIVILKIQLTKYMLIKFTTDYYKSYSNTKLAKILENFMIQQTQQWGF